MNMKCALKAVSIALASVSIALQFYVVVFVVSELFTFGSVGFPSGLAYGASLPFSLTTYLSAWAIMYAARIEIPLKKIHTIFFGSHIFIWLCMFSFPGTFAPQ